MRNFTEANLQIKCDNLQLRNRSESCEEVQNKISRYRLTGPAHVVPW